MNIGKVMLDLLNLKTIIDVTLFLEVLRIQFIQVNQIYYQVLKTINLFKNNKVYLIIFSIK
jgi:hypothetical protein